MVQKTATDLPIKQILAQIDAALAANGVAAEFSECSAPAAPQPRAVLVAPPGAGKSTFLPLHLLRASWAQRGRIILVEPRRLAARAVARYMARQLGEDVGRTIGYAMRMDKNYSAATRILVMTEGSFTRLILDNPELKGISAVLFDEFHERSLDADFGLALTLDVADSLRPDLRILVMSATIDGARIASLLGQDGSSAPIVTAEGRSYPVEIRYRPQGSGARASGRHHERVEQIVAKTCRALLLAETGNILAFLPGQAEIRRTKQLLEDIADTETAKNTLLIPLYGGLSAEDQDAALRPAPQGKRKIVLATAIAETALTIEDVRIVIDCGLARVPVFDAASGITRLRTQRVSQAQAVQRAGRAGRVQAGIVVRLWHEGQFAALPAYTPPEIMTADISAMLLDCADFGIADVRNLRLLDKPSAAAIGKAQHSLQLMQALDKDGRITPWGRALRQVNLPQQQAHMLLLAAMGSKNRAEPAAKLAMLLTERGLGGASDDLDKRLENFIEDKGQRALKAKNMAKKLAKQALSLTEKLPKQSAIQYQAAPLGILRAGALLAPAWEDHIAHLREDSPPGAEAAQYLLASGRGAFLEKDSPLFGRPWLVCTDLSGNGAHMRIRAAAEISQEFLTRFAEERASVSRHIVFDAANGVLRAFKERRLGAILLERVPLPPPEGEEANQAWLQAVRTHGVQILPWNDKAAALRARLEFLHSRLGAPWADVSDKALSENTETWLLPFLPGKARLGVADSDIVTNAVQALLDYNRQKQAESLAPLAVAVPSGRKIAVRYQGEKAILSVRVQELFGMRAHPCLLNGKFPLQLELLSPAGRIMQITTDIIGFWQGTWHDVAAEMRGRYPKHFWPNNPQEAAAVTKAKPRRDAGKKPACSS